MLSDSIQHKTDAGGVVLDLDPASVAREYQAMAASIGPAMQGAVVRPMIGPGAEVIIGTINDPSFGPVIIFGLGGSPATSPEMAPKSTFSATRYGRSSEQSAWASFSAYPPRH